MWDVVGIAWGNDPFGIVAFVNVIVLVFLACIGALITLVMGFKGLQVVISRGSRLEFVEDIICAAIGIAIIIGSPALARAAVPNSSGLGLVALPLSYSLSQDMGDTIGWVLAVGMFGSPGYWGWRLWHGRA
jgi:hypothetical protein